MGEPEFTIVIGANGSGKSTWIQRERDRLSRRFYNADLIAGGLGKADYGEFLMEARAFIDQKIDEDIQAKRSFGLESTYSGQSKPNLVRRVKALGYRAHAVFVGTKNPAVNIDRVAERVALGGHDVEESTIIGNWVRVQERFLDTWTEFDQITLVDNSKSSPRVVMEISEGKARPHLVIHGALPDWAKTLLRQVDSPHYLRLVGGTTGS